MAGKHRRTLRGTVLAQDSVKQLIVDDGRLTHGYRVLRFVILSTNPGASTADSVGTLALSEGGARLWTLSDNRQIGWAGQTMTGSSSPAAEMSLIDPEHIVIQDLWVWGTGTTAHPGYQYFVELEAIDLTEEQTIVTMIKERTQDV
jgi:hypothetical protein